MANFYNETAREKYSLPAEWQWFKMEAVGVPGKYDAVRLTGAVAPLITRGPRKGGKNWQKRDRRTEISLVITDEDIGAFKSRYEKTTGHCAECEGTGQEWAGWSAADGNRFRPCRRCDATGRRPLAGEE